MFENVIPLIEEMRSKGVEQICPYTGRTFMLKALEPSDLLRDAKMPDILTPLVVKSLYQDISDDDVTQIIKGQKETKESAIALLDAMDYICAKSITNGVKVSDLLIAEKRWIFRMVMGPAELLVTFRYEPQSDVGSVDEGEELLETA